MADSLQPRCPACGKPLEDLGDPAARPFCSERCRRIDLWGWFSEAHRIPVDPESASALEETPEKLDAGTSPAPGGSGPKGSGTGGRESPSPHLPVPEDRHD